MKKKNISRIKSGITAPAGFFANGIHSGIKKKNLDLGVIYSEKPCTTVGCFTRNIVKAAPVLFSKENINKGIQAVIVNSGNANACTGKRGYNDTKSIAQLTAELLNISEKKILTCSTGVIGKYLPVNRIKRGIKRLVPLLDKKGYANMAQAILTTDTKKKEIAVQFSIKGKQVKMAGIAKGSGMIAPDMATLLAFITSDLNIEKRVLKDLFSDIIEQTFNKITIDGDMSTNDSVIMMCNGYADNRCVTKNDKKEIKIIYEHLFFIMDYLARELVKDGEGITKVIKVCVNQARSLKEAKKIAFKIANSPLVKTAVYGCDANWGRILASAGAAGVNFNPDQVEIKFGSYSLYKKGVPVSFSEKELKQYLKKREIDININLKQGRESFSVFSTDLTEEYIQINAHYRS